MAFVGDSHLRNQYYALLRLLGSTSEQAPGYHSDMSESVGSATVEFYLKVRSEMRGLAREANCVRSEQREEQSDEAQNLAPFLLVAPTS